jgi:AraC family transcriptional regulator
MLSEPQILEIHTDCIEDVMRYIREHIGEPLDRETLAAVAGFSVPHFHRVFTAHVGESAIGYVRRLRLERAARKLRMGAAFSKAFKQQFGLSPSEFRQLGCWAATQLLRKG